MGEVKEACRALQAAERARDDANAKLEQARDHLDAALAGVGWRRLVGAFNPWRDAALYLSGLSERDAHSRPGARAP